VAFREAQVVEALQIEP